MLRLMRLSAPADRYDDLVAAAHHAWLALHDHYVDTDATRGWPHRGDGRAVALAVVDDNDETGPQIEAAVRGAHIDLTGQPTADWITFDQSYVYLPDAMPAAWYDHVGPLAQALHADEAARATCTPEDLPDLEARIAGTRARLDAIITPAIREATATISRFTADLVMNGMVELLEP